MKYTSLTTEAKAVILQLIDTIDQLTMDEYMEKIGLLSNTSIGEHTRHIIELFQQLSLGYISGNINYDNRKRDIRLEEDINFTIKTLTNLIENIEKVDKKLTITTVYNNQESIIESNYERELMYNIEHCIHHQAIIKIGLLYLNKLEVDTDFGVAKSTIEYRNKCVQ